jgi:hypothetical protein
MSSLRRCSSAFSVVSRRLLGLRQLEGCHLLVVFRGQCVPLFFQVGEALCRLLLRGKAHLDGLLHLGL